VPAEAELPKAMAGGVIKSWRCDGGMFGLKAGTRILSSMFASFFSAG
jgi:hypothetical protein